jgi:hypothetical protein
MKRKPRRDEGRPPLGWELTREVDKNQSVAPKRRISKPQPGRFSWFAGQRTYESRVKMKFLDEPEG